MGQSEDRRGESVEHSVTESSPAFRDAEQQKCFEEKGYVIVRLLEPEQAASFRSQIAGRIPAQPAINDPQGGMYNTAFDSGVSRCLPEQLEMVRTERLDQLLAGYRDIGACVMGKVAGSGRLDLHQHQPSTSNIFAKVIHCWMTLDDVDADHGALRIVPGSHRILRHIQSFDSAPYFAGFQSELEADFAVAVPMKAGEAILMDGSLLHGSCPNPSVHTPLRVFSVHVPSDEPFCIIVESEGPRFDAYAAEGKSIDPNLHCMAGGSLDGLEHMGRLDARNTPLTRAEFEALLALGERIAPGFDPIDVVRSAAAPDTAKPIWQRIGRLLGRREAA